MGISPGNYIIRVHHLHLWLASHSPFVSYVVYVIFCG
ncbi:MAG: hypothetical protein BWY82_01494 [Verrucomicrobia bacterium ADurb.Bin474]|nr:MAG: hypothetical protein BWY82_01494 [Verrucomicrobia bacterium ADurb.Bin474]